MNTYWDGPFEFRKIFFEPLLPSNSYIFVKIVLFFFIFCVKFFLRRHILECSLRNSREIVLKKFWICYSLYVHEHDKVDIFIFTVLNKYFFQNVFLHRDIHVFFRIYLKAYYLSCSLKSRKKIFFYLL